jgi:hypothetical protein
MRPVTSCDMRNSHETLKCSAHKPATATPCSSSHVAIECLATRYVRDERPAHSANPHTTNEAKTRHTETVTTIVTARAMAWPQYQMLSKNSTRPPTR